MLRPLLLAMCLSGAALVPMSAAEPAAAPAIDSTQILAAARAADETYQRTLADLHVRIASEDPAVRTAAMLALARLDDPEAVPLLLPFLALGRPVADNQTAAIALGHLREVAAAPGLRELLANSPEATVRLAAMNALDQIAAAQPGDYLGRSKDGEEVVRAPALTNLGTLAHQPAADVLAWGLLHDRRAVYRRMCAIGLGRLGERSQGANLLDALGDSDPGVRRYAAEALVKLDYTPAVPHLLMALEGNIAGNYINRCLQMLTKQDFGFDWRANEMARREAVERGFKWWTDHAAELQK